jgi:cytochrome P450
MLTLAGRENSIFFTKTTNPRFKTFRMLLHKTLNPRAIQAYRAMQLTECRSFLQGLLETPEDFMAHARR